MSSSVGASSPHNAHQLTALVFLPLALAVREVVAAVALGEARVPVPAVGADLGRPVADIPAQTAVGVVFARLPQAHQVLQTFPRKTTAQNTVPDLPIR